MNLDEYKAGAARHILLYGAPKSGKTAAYGKLAKKFELHVFDNEDSIKTLMNPEILPIELRKNVNLFRIPDTQLYPMAIETMLKVLKPGTNTVCYTHGKVACPICMKDANAKKSTINIAELKVDEDIVVIDSWSQLVASAGNYIMRNELAKDNFDAKMGWDEYGKQGRILERIGSFIQTAPCNIIVVSHEVMVEMEDKSKRIVPVGGTSNASKEFAKYFDDVVYCETINRKHKLTSSTVGKSGVLAGSRAGVELNEGDTLLKLFE